MTKNNDNYDSLAIAVVVAVAGYIGYKMYSDGNDGPGILPFPIPGVEAPDFEDLMPDSLGDGSGGDSLMPDAGDLPIPGSPIPGVSVDQAVDGYKWLRDTGTSTGESLRESAGNYGSDFWHGNWGGGSSGTTTVPDSVDNGSIDVGEQSVTESTDEQIVESTTQDSYSSGGSVEYVDGEDGSGSDGDAPGPGYGSGPFF